MRWDSAWHRRLETEIAALPGLPLDEQAAVRRTLGSDPVAFALIYLSHHLRAAETGDRITFSEVHYAWARQALRWRDPVTDPGQDRVAEIAPRGCGKSTWWFLILILWAAANVHARFVAAFSDTAAQAEAHLATMRTEMDTNPLLRHDYPALCRPSRRKSGATLADRQGMLHTASGFVFGARGVDSSSLGMKVGRHRPEVIILDDIEPDEANYSALLATKRLGTLLDAILPLNIYARVLIVGTVVMPGSVMHQLVKSAHGLEGTPAWIKDEGFEAHHYRAIATNDDGTERSIWPEKWSLGWLQSRRHTREYAKNYDNDPMARDGVYWNRNDFRFGTVEGITRTALYIDPAVTAKKTSDFTGLAVVAYSPSAKKVLVRYATGVRLIGQPLVDAVTKVLADYPEITRVVVEVNQGGDLWPAVFAGLPGVSVHTSTASVSKEVRFAEALRWYQRGAVVHERQLPVLQEQMVGFPRAAYDDVADAAVAGVLHHLAPTKRVRLRETVESYA